MAPTSRFIINIFLSFLVVTALEYATATNDNMPHKCALLHCPPFSEMTCPDDSAVREEIQSFASLDDLNTTQKYPNASELGEEVYAECCLNKKCLCKTCHIPDCGDDDLVLIELMPESMETPGYCCADYECEKEPNCTAVAESKYWLTDCKRCKCYFGERICEVTCDESMKKSTSICNSKNLNTYFGEGEVWRDGCYECECVSGEEKCVMPFCRSLNCPPHRQVTLKDSCCPVCWPAGAPMPNSDNDFYEGDNENNIAANSYHNEDNHHGQLPHYPMTMKNEFEDLPDPNKDDDYNRVNSSTTENTIIEETSRFSATTTKETEQMQSTVTNNVIKTVTTTVSPSTIATAISQDVIVDDEEDLPAKTYYPVIPEVVELCRKEFLYGLIAILVIIVAILTSWNIYLRGKQRSYCPVSNIDDNCNKMSCNIKKMPDYA